MKWFGPEGWDAPICKDALRAKTSSQPCFRCHQTFEAYDRGLVMMSLVSQEDHLIQQEYPIHLTCLAVDIGLVTVHVLRSGRACCNFSLRVPGEWPNGHLWVPQKEWQKASCGECRRLGEMLSQ